MDQVMRDSFFTTMLSVYAFGIGACIASFLNVVIWRMPRGESIVSPPSHCPRCNARIRWYQNIPILSWLCLRGRCASCRAPISPRYIMVETLGGVLFLLAFRRFGIGVPLSLAAITVPVTWVWLSLMMVGSFIDYDHKLLPDFTTVGGMVLGVLYSVALSLYFGDWFQLVGSISGLAFGFGLLWLVRWLGSIAFKREAMGLGDVFLMGAIGAMSGPVAVLFVLIVSSFLGSICGLLLVALRRTRFGGFAEIPFGPYLCLAEVIFLFYGPEIISLYLSFVRT